MLRNEGVSSFFKGLTPKVRFRLLEIGAVIDGLFVCADYGGGPEASVQLHSRADTHSPVRWIRIDLTFRNGGWENRCGACHDIDDGWVANARWWRDELTTKLFTEILRSSNATYQSFSPLIAIQNSILKQMHDRRSHLFQSVWTTCYNYAKFTSNCKNTQSFIYFGSRCGIPIF